MTTRCAETIPGLATGGPVRRWRARRHAAGCTQCAAALADLGGIEAELGLVPPLTPAGRAGWLAAADEPAPVPARRPRLVRPALAAAALMLVGAAGL